MPSPAGSIPNCIIRVNFNEGPPPSFSFCQTHSGCGWHVQPDGSILPPCPWRVIRFTLQAFPSTINAQFAGFMLSSTGSFPTNTNWTPRPELLSLGVKVITPACYPEANHSTWKTLGPLTFEFPLPEIGSSSNRQLFYRLAVAVGDNGPYWDDPKIYDDGSD